MLLQKINIIPHSNRIRIYVDDEENRYFRLRTIKRELGNIVVKGIPTVSRAVISKKADDPKQNSLFVEGYGLREVMNCEGVIGTQTTTNHVRLTENVAPEDERPLIGPCPLPADHGDGRRPWH